MARNIKASKVVGLSRREREIMDVVYNLGGGEGHATATIRQAMVEPGSYSAVRAQLRILVEKGHLHFYHDGPRYLFEPTVPREQAQESALRHVLRTFFGGSTQEAMVALLAIDDELSGEQRQRLEELVTAARKEGR